MNFNNETGTASCSLPVLDYIRAHPLWRIDE
jgi:hypothetical protein